MRAVLPRARDLMQAHPGQNIEVLLRPDGPLENQPEDQAILKRAIRRTFERRQLGHLALRFGAPDPSIRYKLDIYARLIGCMEHGDCVVSFNYDNAFEYVYACLTGNTNWLNVSELAPNQLRFLQQEAVHRWIDSRSIPALRQRTIRYAPAACFSDRPPSFGTGPIEIDLYKVHGSMNWFVGSDQQIHVGPPPTSSVPPLLAYPEPDKLDTQRPPLQHVMNSAVEAIGRFRRVVVLGYSFPASDSHQHPFVAPLREAMGAMEALVVDPSEAHPLRGGIEGSGRSTFVLERFENGFSSTQFNGGNLLEFVRTMRSQP